MTKHLPPVPPDNQEKKGPAQPLKQPNEAKGKKPAPENLREQGRQGNTWQNTHHQGYQQDR